MTKIRKAPRWCGVFLRALAGCGEVRRAAAMAGVDFTTAYLRRKSHAEFAEGWAEALAAFGAHSEVAPPPFPSMREWSPSPGKPGEETRDLVLHPGSGGARAARAGAGRWNAAAEKRFFTALADRANVRDAAAAAGFSTNAIYARRSRRPEFRRAWEAAVETGKARLQMLLMDAAEKAFDPELLDVSEEAPNVSVSDALNILKAREGQEKAASAKRDSWGDPSVEMSQEDEDELRARFMAKLERLLLQDQERKIAKGWTRYGNDLVPPGWCPAPIGSSRPRTHPTCARRIGLG